MKTYEIELVSAPGSELSQSQHNPKPKDYKADGEMSAHEAWEEASWQEKAHWHDGVAHIPASAIKQALTSAARYRGEQLPGKGKKTYTQKFESGVMITKDLSLGIHKESDLGKGYLKRTFLCNADGKRGSGKRVPRTFPHFPSWKATLEIHVLDDQDITKEVLINHLDTAGKFIGIGRFRAEKGGTCGRFTIGSVKCTMGAN